MPTDVLTSSRPDRQELRISTDKRTTNPVTPPTRSIEQRMTALQRANDIRTKRAEVKRTVKRSKNPQPLVMQLADPASHFETMKVFDLLVSLPKVGRVKANKILRTARISPSKTIGGLSDRQRREVLSLLPAGARPRRFTRDPQYAEAIA